MARFRKKPVVIDAFQWMGDPDAFSEWLAPLEIHIGTTAKFVRHDNGYIALVIKTLETVGGDPASLVASQGDWIIRGVNGELYPCKPDIFEKTYEAEE